MCLGRAVSLGAGCSGDFIARFLSKSLAKMPVGDLKVSLAPLAVISSFSRGTVSVFRVTGSPGFCDDILGLCVVGGGGSADVVGLVVFLRLGGEWEASLIGSSFSSSPKPPSPLALNR